MTSLRSHTLATQEYLVTKLVLRTSTPAGRFWSFMCLYIHVISYSIIFAAVEDSYHPLRKESSSGNFFLVVELVPAPCPTSPAAEQLSRRNSQTIKLLIFRLDGVNLPLFGDANFLPLVVCHEHGG